MEKKEKNPLAMGLGRLGGLKTAQRGSEYYKNISKLGKEARRRNKINKIEAIVLVEEKVDENRLDGAGNAVVL